MQWTLEIDFLMSKNFWAFQVFWLIFIFAENVIKNQKMWIEKLDDELKTNKRTMCFILHMLPCLPSQRSPNIKNLYHFCVDCPLLFLSPVPEFLANTQFTHLNTVMNSIGCTRLLILSQVMDDRWESEITEYGAINITGFRLVDTERRYVREFLESWKRLDPITSIGAGKESITVWKLLLANGHSGNIQ